MNGLKLELEGLRPKDEQLPDVTEFFLADIQNMIWDWIVKGAHPVNCWYQRHCNFNIFVKDGMVLREEQAGNYPPPNDPYVTNPNPNPANPATELS
ncbi:MAG: hypothetical protein QF619_06815 [Candidatus Binatia bacterium]|nr:hypothetical protein [Candidatus Binatia bacterium]